MLEVEIHGMRLHHGLLENNKFFLPFLEDLLTFCHQIDEMLVAHKH